MGIGPVHAPHNKQLTSVVPSTSLPWFVILRTTISVADRGRKAERSHFDSLVNEAGRLHLLVTRILHLFHLLTSCADTTRLCPPCLSLPWPAFIVVALIATTASRGLEMCAHRAE